MMTSRAEKKRKVIYGQAKKKRNECGGQDDDVTVVSVKVENDQSDSKVIDDSKLTKIQKIIRADLSSKSPAVVVSGLVQLGKLMEVTESARENCAAVHETGGVYIIVNTMRHWLNVPVIQSYGCIALQNYIAQDIANNYNLSYAKGARNGGAIDAVVQALKSFPHDPAVQRRGWGALFNLMFDYEENAKHFKDNLDGIKFIIEAMTNSRENLEIQEWGCSTLASLSKWNSCKAPIIEAGGFTALSYAIDNHKDKSKAHVEEIQKCAIIAIRQLST